MYSYKTKIMIWLTLPNDVANRKTESKAKVNNKNVQLAIERQGDKIATLNFKEDTLVVHALVPRYNVVVTHNSSYLCTQVHASLKCARKK